MRYAGFPALCCAIVMAFPTATAHANDADRDRLERDRAVEQLYERQRQEQERVRRQMEEQRAIDRRLADDLARERADMLRRTEPGKKP